MNIKVVLTAPAMADNQDEEGEEVQLAEVIASQEELEDTANAVLGDSDDTNCSYSRVKANTCTKCKWACSHQPYRSHYLFCVTGICSTSSIVCVYHLCAN